MKTQQQCRAVRDDKPLEVSDFHQWEFRNSPKWRTPSRSDHALATSDQSGQTLQASMISAG